MDEKESNKELDKRTYRFKFANAQKEITRLNAELKENEKYLTEKQVKSISRQVKELQKEHEKEIKKHTAYINLLHEQREKKQQKIRKKLNELEEEVEFSGKYTNDDFRAGVLATLKELAEYFKFDMEGYSKTRRPGNMIECWHCKRWYSEALDRCPKCSYRKDWTLEEQEKEAGKS